MEKEEKAGRLVDMATAAVQAQQRLCHSLKLTSAQHQLLQENHNLLDQMREVKSKLEGTAVVQVATPNVKHDIQQQLQQLIRMHIPPSLTEEDRKTITALVYRIFEGIEAEVVMVGLVSCPWYVSCHRDRGLQAKHNSLVVVYKLANHMVFTPVNQHVSDADAALDLGWLYLTEVFHFSRYLARGKVRFVEALLSPDCSIVHSTPLWQELRNSIEPSILTGIRGFVEQSRGQAIGATGRKSKAGKMVMRDNATLYEFAEGCRLMQHAERVVTGQGLIGLEVPLNTECLSGTTQQAHHLLHTLYNDEQLSEAREATRAKLFETLLQWRHEVDKLVKSFKFTDPKTAENAIGGWLEKVRMNDSIIAMPPLIPRSEAQKQWVSGLLGDLNPKLQSVHVDDVIAVARVGSYLYGLSTQDSDVDYAVIFRHKTKGVLRDLGKIKENLESKGPEKAMDFGAHEVRLFCEMLLKGSVVITELLFADDLEYVTEQWMDLVKMKQIFVTENLILQYFGLIKNNMVNIESGKYKDQPRERKLFYQVFHKAAAIERMSRGLVPQVKCQEPLRTFILKIRTQPLQGETSRDVLIEKAREEIAGLREGLAQRDWRHPEHVHYASLKQWLLDARGIHST